MKLRHSHNSPFVRKVMLVAHHHGLLDRIDIVPVSRPATQAFGLATPENPLMKIPALTTDDGTVLFDSPVICEYLDTIGSRRKLFPAEGPARWTALRQQALGDGIGDSVILCSYELRRPEAQRSPEWTESQMARVHQGLAAAEAEDLAGLSTIGPIAVACAIGYLDFRFPDDGWRERHPKLAAWHREVAQLPAMQATQAPAS
jgi:glutathione S-transferase